MSLQSVNTTTALFVLVATTTCGHLFAQTIPLADQSQSAPDLHSLTHKVVELVYADGHVEWPLTIAKVEAGTTAGSLKSVYVKFKDQKRLRKVSATKISEIILDNQPLDVQYER